MCTFAHLPVTAQDKSIIESLAKVCCALMRKAAGLGKEFPPFNRNQLDFFARGLGRSSAGALFASAPQSLAPIKVKLKRDDVRALLTRALVKGLADLPPGEKNKLADHHLERIGRALPGIVQSVDPILKSLEVDRLTIERKEIDPLLAKYVPPYEYALVRDRSKVFVMEKAREQLRARLDALGAGAVPVLDRKEVLAIVQNSFYPLVDLVTEMHFPLEHKTIVFTDEESNVVGAGFQHPSHGGVVPICCESVSRFAAVWAALSLPVQAQMSGLPSDFPGTENPNYVLPVRTGFTHKRDSALPKVYFARVEPEQAFEYLKKLETACDGARVKYTDGVPQELRGATLNWYDVFTPGNKKTRRRWGLYSVPSEVGATFIMSGSGTAAYGILSESQWYLRQEVWLDEADFPELGVPLAYPVDPQPFDNEPTKIIPASAKSFYQRARAHVNTMPEAKKASPQVRAALKKIKDQDNRLRAIQSVIEKEVEARRLAAGPSLTRFGFAGALSPVPIDN